MDFSNINSVKNVVLQFLKVKIRKALQCNIVSSDGILKSNYLKSYSCELIKKFLNFSQVFPFLVNFFIIHIKCLFDFLFLI